MPQQDADVRRALATLRLIWAALLMGQGMAAAVVLMLVMDDAFDVGATDGVADALRYLGVAMLIVASPLALFIRAQVYKANWRGSAITPRGYITGNIILLAMLEGVAIAAMIFMVIGGLDFILLGVAAAAAGLQIVNFPTGRPMIPVQPVFPDGGVW